jgi:hypothetical protein
MSFQPSIIGTGLVGWQFLQATQARQKEAFNAAPLLQRDTAYFEERIGSITSAQELVDDRRLLRVALGAFGLQDDINSKFFIRKVLEEGVGERTALANRLADERYKSLAREFAFDTASPGPRKSGFAAEIVTRFRQQEFEIAVGEQNQALRLAMNFERGLTEIANADSSADAKWFRVMGTPPVRTVMETALGLPKSFAQLDIDDQLEVFRDKANSRFGAGEVDELVSDGRIEDVVQAYLLREQINQFSAANTSAQTALTLLQTITR